MTKYSFEFKLNIVREYLEGKARTTYSVQFKLNEIESYQTSERPYRETANLFKMNSSFMKNH